MNAIQIFEARYLDLHGRVFRSMTEALDETQLRGRPIAGLNPAAWILWHIARAEDVGVNRLVTDGVQVLDEDWHRRLGVREVSAGTGMTPGQVDDLASRIDLKGLWGYLEAVHRRTRAVLAALDPRQLSEPLSAAQVERVMVGEGVLLPPAHGFLPLYADKTRGWFLAHLGLAHGYYHVGQLSVARRLWSSGGDTRIVARHDRKATGPG